MHQRPNSLSMMWERSLMTDFLMSMAAFLRELYALYIALVFHSRVSKLTQYLNLSICEVWVPLRRYPIRECLCAVTSYETACASLPHTRIPLRRYFIHDCLSAATLYVSAFAWPPHTRLPLCLYHVCGISYHVSLCRYLVRKCFCVVATQDTSRSLCLEFKKRS